MGDKPENICIIGSSCGGAYSLTIHPIHQSEIMRPLYSVSLRLALFTLLIVGVGACSEDTTGNDTLDTSSVTGKVVDSETGEPIAGALVSTEPATQATTTDSTGKYTISNLIPGAYTVVVEKGGYTTKRASVQVLGNKAATLDVLLTSTIVVEPSDSLVQVLSFDGTDDMVVIPDSDLSDLSDGSFTIELWVRPHTLKNSGVNGSNDRWNCLVGHGLNNVDLDYLLGIENGNPMFYVRRYDAGRVGTTSFATDTWHHYAVVSDVDAGELRIYINGMLDSKTGLSGAPQQSAADVFVGAREANGTGEGAHFFDGELFELRMWNVARTVEEISNNRWSVLSGSESGLVGYWPMTDGSGASVSEATGMNNAGAIDGAEWKMVPNPMFR